MSKHTPGPKHNLIKKFPIKKALTELTKILKSPALMDAAKSLDAARIVAECLGPAKVKRGRKIK